MNLFPPLFLILVFIMPGVAFYYTFNSGTWNSPREINTYGENFAYGFLLAPFIHLILIVPFNVDLGQVVQSLSEASQKNNAYLNLGYYVLGVNALSFFLACIIHQEI